MKPTRVVGLVLCKRLHVDPGLAELSLVGLFHSLELASWPSAPQSFTVYTALHGGEGEGRMELIVTQMATELDLFRRRWWYALPGRRRTVHLEVPIRRCVFPAPGRYGVTLRFENEDLNRRSFDVNARRGNP